MIRHYTDKELNSVLQEMQIIADSREQVNDHITDYFVKSKVNFITRKLEYGDYSAQLGKYTFEKDFVIERKHNLDELCGNLTADRDRFKREFCKAKADGCKVYLIIEEASLDDVYMQNYRSKLSSKSLLASLFSWQTRYNVTVIFCKKQNTAKIISQILYYAVREQLINGK